MEKGRERMALLMACFELGGVVQACSHSTEPLSGDLASQREPIPKQKLKGAGVAAQCKAWGQPPVR